MREGAAAGVNVSDMSYPPETSTGDKSDVEVAMGEYDGVIASARTSWEWSRFVDVRAKLDEEGM